VTSDLRLADTGDGFLRSGRARFHEDLAPLMRRIDDVQPAPYNYNNGDVQAVEESIMASGMYRPIFVQKSTGYIIAGNHTWQACKEMGSDVIPVVVLDVDDTAARRIMVADNQIARAAQPDNGLLMALLDEIPDPNIGTGLSADDVEQLRLLNEIPLDTDEDSFAQWPTFSVKVPPHVLRGFMVMTSKADNDRDRFELLLRMAGWEG
jgi:hypothetical protein